MKIKNNFTKTKKKDCLNQDRFVYKINNKINEDFISFLKSFGPVRVFRDFQIPLIKMDIPKKFRLSALMNSQDINIFFKNKDFMKKFEKKLDKNQSLIPTYS